MTDKAKFDKVEVEKVKCYVTGVKNPETGKVESQVTHKGHQCAIGDEITVTKRSFDHMEKLGRVSKSPIIIN